MSAQGAPDRGLQPERTALAWRRTGLALLGAALVLARVIAEGSLPLAILAATVGIVLAIGIMVVVQRRYRSQRQRMIESAGGRIRLADGGLPALLAVSTAALGVVALLVVVLLSMTLN